MAELSSYLQQILEAVREHAPEIPVDAKGEPDPDTVRRLAARLGEDANDVRNALLGLRATDCLMEVAVDFPGIEPITWWTVHPQCGPVEGL